MEEGLVGKFLSYIKTLPLDFDQEPGEFSYGNSVLILVDAVLSICRRYDSFVVPRVELARKWPFQTLAGLKARIQEVGIRGFCQDWNYNHPERVGLLLRLIERFLEIKQQSGIENDFEALRFWGRTSSVEDFRSFEVRGVGFATFQYLRLLCGADTVKPDVHLKRAVRDGTGKDLTKREVVALVEAVAEMHHIFARRLDYALWKYYSSR